MEKFDMLERTNGDTLAVVESQKAVHLKLHCKTFNLDKLVDRQFSVEQRLNTFEAASGWDFNDFEATNNEESCV